MTASRFGPFALRFAAALVMAAWYMFSELIQGLGLLGLFIYF